MDPLWSETCWSNFKYFKYFIIILIVSTNYIFVHLLDNKVFYSNTEYETRFISGANAYMFRHQCAIIKEFIKKTRVCRSNTYCRRYSPSLPTWKLRVLKCYERLKCLLDLKTFVVDKLPDDGTLVAKYVGVGTWYQVFCNLFFVCVLIRVFCWILKIENTTL